MKPICCLECTDSFLVSGDMDNIIVLWAINASVPGATQPVSLCKLAMWPSILTQRALFSILRKPHGAPTPKSGTEQGLWMSIAGKEGDCCIWYVDVIRSGKLIERHDSADSDAELGGPHHEHVVDSAEDIEQIIEMIQKEGLDYHVFTDAITKGYQVSISVWNTVDLGLEIDCMRLSGSKPPITTGDFSALKSESKSDEEKEASINEECRPTKLYFGTPEGRVIRQGLGF